jgi:CheY-like chemotaxis protein
MEGKTMAKVLIVDDDELFRTMLTEMVSREGHQVAVAVDGNDALRQVGRSRPDVVITDILMPEKDGIELIMLLSQQEHKIPIIAMSGGRRAISPEFNLESARLMGVSSTLNKPFNREALRRAIQDAIGA